MLVLGIETSCDDTACALVEDGQVLSNVVSSQYKVHQAFGGVVPELAARAHLENMAPTFEAAFRSAERSLDDVDVIAVTTGPGLQIALLVGIAEAKGLAVSTGKPLVAVNHLRAHLYAASMAHPDLEFPAVGLLVSGGHTSIVVLEGPGQIRELGRTRDDAAGECFDKVARVAGLPGAGGPAIQKNAAGGDPKAFRLPRARVKGAPLDFSFSGLKTAAARLYQDEAPPLADFCASFQQAVVDALVARARRAVELLDEEGTPAKALVVAGGVGANAALRDAMQALGAERGMPFKPTPLSLCTDNGAMIAGLGGAEFLRRGPDELDVAVRPGLGFKDPAGRDR